ncbi:TadE/TadG family type IV pilus assembly protein [Sphingosinicella humi]|uniref:Pilus assembly protein TadE n=1 Tax=Allosphingosinicella humi TaxID=2068657 RepID=A0A2U2J5X3_9SPHN|nr:TadE family protein [Sphingosinicella humi]PWG03734.1 pilus assembly protein TadE [Sphingosinicella humi]
MISRLRILVRGLRRLHACRGGSAAVEAAFLLPLFMLALLGTFEMARVGWAQSTLNFAVQEAARCSAVRQDLCGTPARTAEFAAQKASGLRVSPEAFSVSVQSCGTEVRATVEHKLILYRVFPSGPTLTAEFCRP